MSADFADDYPDEYLECRVFGHPWKTHGRVTRPSRWQYRQEVACLRCTATRVQLISVATGEIKHSYLHYPPGFLRKGQGRLDRRGRGRARLHLLEKGT